MEVVSVCICRRELYYIISATCPIKATDIHLFYNCAEQKYIHLLKRFSKRELTVLSFCPISNLFILSGKVRGIFVLFSRVIHGCFNASVAEYL